MTMTIEKNLRDFDFWSAAATNAAKLTSEELDVLESMMEEVRNGDEPWSVEEINDFMRFDFEIVCEWLGLNYEEVMARD